jgi:hypothetical protein
MRDKLLKLLIGTRHSFSVIFGSSGILLVYILWSQEILKKPNLLIWVSIYVVFQGIGSAIDYYQTKLTKDS